jgi:hypothetical protein
MRCERGRAWFGLGRGGRVLLLASLVLIALPAASTTTVVLDPAPADSGDVDPLRVDPLREEATTSPAPDGGQARSAPGEGAPADEDGIPRHEEVGGLILDPLVTGPTARLIVIALAYLVCWFGTDLVVPRLARDPRPRPAPTPADPDAERRIDPGKAVAPAEIARRAVEVAAVKRLGRIIGKCENVLTVTFVVAGQETGLAIIFTAKAIARQQEIRRDSGYYLGGTLLNFTISFAIASVARVLIAGLS